MKNHFIVYIMIFLISGCVSVQLPSGKSTPAKDIEFKEPESPFKEIKGSTFDKAWMSSKTGNTISFLSECGNGNDPSLSQLENDSLAALSDIKILKSDDVEFNNRAARESVAQGQVDGVPVKLHLMVFKKNGCNYTLSFGGVEKNHSLEEKNFEQFLKNFKAP